MFEDTYRKSSILSSVSLFLLWAQFIEFELRDVFFELDSHLGEIQEEYDPRFPITKHFSENSKQLTLGYLAEVLKKMNWNKSKKLDRGLCELVRIRNKITHRIFLAVYSIQDIERDVNTELKSRKMSGLI